MNDMKLLIKGYLGQNKTNTIKPTYNKTLGKIFYEPHRHCQHQYHVPRMPSFNSKKEPKRKGSSYSEDCQEESKAGPIDG